jgi:hypothetical protein
MSQPSFDTSTHRLGCGHARTGSCICAFLSQWDSKPALPEGTWEDRPLGADITTPAKNFPVPERAVVQVQKATIGTLTRELSSQKRWNLALLVLLAAEGAYIAGMTFGWPW